MSIGKRISERREELGLTQEELGRQVGVIKGAVSAWESGATPVSLRRARTLANILSRSVIWLVHGVEPGAIESNQIDGGSIVPRVRMSDVIDFTSGNIKATTFARTHFACSVNAFATSVTDDANKPRFSIGDRIVIDPEESPEPGDMVLAVSSDASHTIFARYTMGGLEFLNPDWQTREKTPLDSINIVGVMTEHASPRLRR